MLYITRDMKKFDIQILYQLCKRQGENKTLSQFEHYLSEQQEGFIKVIICEYESEIAGYIIVRRFAKFGPYKKHKIPQIEDISIFPPYDEHGLRDFLMKTAEKFCSKYGDYICMPCTFSQEGLKQQVYLSSLGYSYDGTGIWCADRLIEFNCDLSTSKIYFKKTLNRFFL